MNRIFRLGGSLVAGISALLALPLQAVAGGPAEDWQIGFQEAVTPVMHEIVWFHNQLLLPIIIVISLFVGALMLIVMIRFNRRSNPVPSKTTHHTLLEVAWTIIPVLILVVIAIPSFRILYLQREIPPADMTIKATGNQWYWTYEYPDHGNFIFDSLMIEDEDLKEGQLRLLAVDNEVVVPVGQVVRMIVTGSDVIHNWAMPAFGIKMDGIPGRLNETWFMAEQTGVYYGQCSELCGVRHAFMPIAVRVVSEADFAIWIERAREEFASADPAVSQSTQIAQIQN